VCTPLATPYLRAASAACFSAIYEKGSQPLAIFKNKIHARPSTLLCLRGLKLGSLAKMRKQFNLMTPKSKFFLPKKLTLLEPHQSVIRRSSGIMGILLHWQWKLIV
jgi:hypothetical protein